jgi:hypothetical protein
MRRLNADVSYRRPLLCSALAAALLALVGVAPASAAPTAKPVLPDIDALGATGSPAPDTVLVTEPGARLAARAAGLGGFGGLVKTTGGDTFKLYLSPRYGANKAVLAAWTRFFGDLVHGDELQKLTVVVAPFREIAGMCGEATNGCYAPADDLLTIPGETPPDGTRVEEIAAHEYGHHIANNRSNYPWDAIEWGTKRWATGQEICERVRGGEVFPGETGKRYSLNPGEAFADSYRVLVGGRWSGLFDASLKPRAADLALIRQDILDPWQRNATEVRRDAFPATGFPLRRYTFETPLDGRLKLDLRGADGQDLDVALYDGKRKLVDSATPGTSRESLRGDLCGVREVTVIVRRVQGAGDFRLEVSLA